MLRIAVAKGRTEKEVLKLFERCGIYFDEHNKTRKLILRDRNEKLELILTKPVDTTVYVETGAADCGIVGKDILLENDADVYSLLSLGIARCKMCVAKKRGDDFQQNKFITVATKFPRIAKKYFDEKTSTAKSFISAAPWSWRRSSILPMSLWTLSRPAPRSKKTTSSLPMTSSKTSAPALLPTKSV